MSDIRAVLELIPEDSEHEALLAIQSITTYPPSSFKLRCHLSEKFSLLVQAKGETISIINDENDALITTSTKKTFLSDLKRAIHSVDEEISRGVVLRKMRPSNVIVMNEPPADMDLPVWDEESKTWHDAEY